VLRICEIPIWLSSTCPTSSKGRLITLSRPWPKGKSGTTQLRHIRVRLRSTFGRNPSAPGIKVPILSARWSGSRPAKKCAPQSGISAQIHRKPSSQRPRSEAALRSFIRVRLRLRVAVCFCFLMATLTLCLALMDRLPGFAIFILSRCRSLTSGALTHGSTFHKWRGMARRMLSRIRRPALEPLELFTTKSGEEIVGQLTTHGQRRARGLPAPEMTPPCTNDCAYDGAIKTVQMVRPAAALRYERQQKGAYVSTSSSTPNYR